MEPRPTIQNENMVFRLGNNRVAFAHFLLGLELETGALYKILHNNITNNIMQIKGLTEKDDCLGQ